TNISGNNVIINTGLTNTLSSGGLVTNGAIVNPVSLTKSGAGIWTLSGTNTYSGGTTVSAGVLTITTTNALPGWNTSGRYSVASGATLAVGTNITDDNVTNMVYGTTNFASGSAIGYDTMGGSRTLSLVLSNTTNGAGVLGLTKVGEGTLTITNANTYTGTTTISGGTLIASNASALGAASGSLAVTAGTLNLAGNNITKAGLSGGAGGVITNGTGSATLTLVNSNTSFGTYNGTIAGSTALRVTNTAIPTNGSSVLTLGASNSYTGGTTIGNAQVLITNGAALGSGGVNVTIGGQTNAAFGGSLALGGGGAFTVTNNITNASQGYGGFGGGVVNSSGSNTISGTITMTDFNNSRISATGGTLVLSGGVVFTGGASWNNPFHSSGANIVLNSAITGSATSIGIIGNSSGGGTLILGTNNAWTNTMSLQLGSGQSSARVDLNGTDQSIRGISFASGQTNASGASILSSNRIFNTSFNLSTLTVNNSGPVNASNTFGGNLALVKTNVGNLVLWASNNYTGGTTISEGTLSVSNANALGDASGTLTAAGGTLNLGAFTIARSGLVTFSGGTVTNGTLSNNTTDFAGQSGTVAAILAGSAGLTKTGTGTLTLSASNTYSGGTTINAGTLSVSNANALGDASGTLTAAGGTLNLGAFTIARSGLVTFSGG
ncbi:MAG: autotransporter-associated beta strand repeat-containing protein, partial [Chthoniobacterales bacterium]